MVQLRASEDLKFTRTLAAGGAAPARELTANSLVPASPAIPAATKENKHHDDNDEKCRRIHAVLLWPSPQKIGTRTLTVSSGARCPPFWVESAFQGGGHAQAQISAKSRSSWSIIELDLGQLNRNIALCPLIIEISDDEQCNDQCANNQCRDGFHPTLRCGGYLPRSASLTPPMVF